MLLEQIDIVRFRGLNRISLSLDNSTVLIGENAWGKSSLLDALRLVLSHQDDLYQFKEQDFYVSVDHNQDRKKTLQILLTFCESFPGEAQTHRYQRLSPAWIKQDDGKYRLRYQVSGELRDKSEIVTQHCFLNITGNPLPLPHSDALAKELIRLHPVLRLRYMNFNNGINSADMSDDLPLHKLIREKQHADMPLMLTDQQIKQSICAIRSIVERYFAGQHALSVNSTHYDYNPNIYDWSSLEHLNQLVDEPDNGGIRLALMGIFAAVIKAKGNMILDPQAQPIMLIEEPESRLHPLMMTVAWRLFSHLPLQKITTSNSGELLSLVPVEHVCRMVRNNNSVQTYRLSDHGLSAEDNRRISFHIRFNRASTLFSRCWLLVEGETEVWMLNELARLCNYHFSTEGIKIIEFAQCGLKPLIKFATQMGIEWHVMVDGDEAGRKYARTTRAYIKSEHEPEKERLTILPAFDMEHFMYQEGFKDVYQRVALYQETQGKISPHKIIKKAINRTSKPDLAIAVAEQVVMRGINSVPHLLRNMFAQVVRLARRRAEY